MPLQQYAYLVTKSSDKIIFCCPISILGDEIFYLLPNINLRRRIHCKTEITLGGK
jgi:hypothetical protein